MHGQKDSETVKFEVGNLLDFSYCLKPSRKDQVRPESRYLFISSIKVSVKLLKNGSL